MKITCVLATASCIAAIAGCRNAVYFYQRDALSLTAEGRLNDPTSPLSANLGFKERVVLIVPPSDMTAAPEVTGSSSGASEAGTTHQTVGTQGNIASSPASTGEGAGRTTELRGPEVPKDDAVSVISYFDFVKANGSRITNPGLTIQSSFITGAAARAVTRENKTAAVAKAITGFDTLRRADMTAISAMYDVVKTRTDDEAIALIAQLDGLFKQVPAAWPVDVFTQGSASAVALQIREADRVHEAVTSRVSSEGFEGLHQYWTTLRDSHALLNEAAPSGAIATKPDSFAPGSSLNGTSLTEASSERARRIVLDARDRTGERIDELETRIAKSGVLSRLVAYYSNTFGK